MEEQGNTILVRNRDVLKNMRKYQFLGQHKCTVVPSASIEMYQNREKNKIEWYYVTEGFYNAEKVDRCPFCHVELMAKDVSA